MYIFLCSFALGEVGDPRLSTISCIYFYLGHYLPILELPVYYRGTLARQKT